jgi:hypothetical protein
VAVRKRADAPPATEEELEGKKLIASMVRESVIKECLKGLIAFPLVVAGGSLVWWCSKWHGSIVWFAGITGLVIVAVGFSLAEGLIESLINKNLAKEIAVLIKEGAMKFQMKEWMKAFLGFLSIIGGIGLLVTAWEQADYYVPDWALYCVGILLFTGGVTFFWTRSTFYKS